MLEKRETVSCTLKYPNWSSYNLSSQASCGRGHSLNGPQISQSACTSISSKHLRTTLTTVITFHRSVATLIVTKNIITLASKQQSTPQQSTLTYHHSTQSLHLVEQLGPTGSLTSVTITATAQTGSRNFPKSHKPMGHLDQ